LNEVQNHVSHLNALSDQILEHEIPMDDLSLNEPDDLNGRSFLLLCRMSFCLSKVCRCEVHEIPMDGQSWSVLDGLMDALSGRSFWHRGQMSFCLSRVCQKMVCQFLAHEIPKDGLNEMQAYARPLNQNRVSRYKKVCLTSSFFPGGRRLDLRCVAYLTTRALERGHQILGHRRSFCCSALRDRLLCDEACDLLQF
jgi:hypothetical protein